MPKLVNFQMSTVLDGYSFPMCTVTPLFTNLIQYFSSFWMDTACNMPSLGDSMSTSGTDATPVEGNVQFITN
jgi:hypothetical protein